MKLTLYNILDFIITKLFLNYRTKAEKPLLDKKKKVGIPNSIGGSNLYNELWLTRRAFECPYNSQGC
jgi:hypothetical protein